MSRSRGEHRTVRSHGQRSLSGRRCAIYTRKSSEEGLEQDFNSLHAQREACEAFILSQKHEGWSLQPDLYDDGGYSGGSLNRPALQRLMDDVQAGKVDVIVVYKVDRLTRSLADFAKIVEILDAKCVSFVSVTQQFNTTSSMGRLTLNVLLSFAQFEREVTGERIRDKIAASKKKGMWMGGNLPIGYDARNRSLVVNDGEAETVRCLFALYLKLGNVRLVQREAQRIGLKSKHRVDSDGRAYGGTSFSRGAIYKILSNPIYVGEIVHKAERYPGSHLPIIDRQLWESVQGLLSDNAARERGQVAAQSPSVLAGLIFDEDGDPLTPAHAKNHGRRYRYYVSNTLIRRSSDSDPSPGHASGWRLPAAEIEEVVLTGLQNFLVDQRRLLDGLSLQEIEAHRISGMFSDAAELSEKLRQGSEAAKKGGLRDLLQMVRIASDRVHIEIRRTALRRRIGLLAEPVARGPSECDSIHLSVAVTLKRRGTELCLVLSDGEPRRRPDASLIRAVGLGHSWLEELSSGSIESIAAIAEREKTSDRLVRRYIDLAFMPPDLFEAVLAGQQPVELTNETFKDIYPLPLAWDEQRKVLGF